jgi:hypothetical protein
MFKCIRRFASWIERESPALLLKEILKYVLLGFLAWFGAWLLTGINRLFHLQPPLTTENLLEQSIEFFRLAWERPLDFLLVPLLRDPIHSGAAPAITIVTIVGIILFRRANRKVEELLAETTAAESLVDQLGIGGRWPSALKHSSGNTPWPDLCKEIERSQNITLDILCANGAETFGKEESPLYNLMQQFRGIIRVILLSPDSEHMADRAMSISCNVNDYKRLIRTSQNRLRELRRRLPYSVAARFYDGQPNWKLILTSRTAWVQYYAPTGKNVNETPVFRFDATDDGSSLFHLFRMEYDRIWRRCEDHPMSLD